MKKVLVAILVFVFGVSALCGGAFLIPELLKNHSSKETSTSVQDPQTSTTAKGDWLDYKWSNDQLPGSGTVSDPYRIGNPQQLARMAYNVANHYYGGSASSVTNFYYFKLTADIDLSEHFWTPIGNYSIAFSGCFDGGGYTISGLTISQNDEYPAVDYGLFGYTKNATVQNLIIRDSVINFQNIYGDVDEIVNTGIVVGGAEEKLTLQNVNCENCRIETVRDSDLTSIKNKLNAFYGGLVGRIKGGFSIENCQNRGGEISFNMERPIGWSKDESDQVAWWELAVGGIVGAINCTKDGQSQIVNCYNSSPITYTISHGTREFLGGCQVGGIVGYIRSTYGGSETDNKVVTIRRNINAGLIQFKASNTSSWYSCVSYPLSAEASSDYNTYYNSYFKGLGGIRAKMANQDYGAAINGRTAFGGIVGSGEEGFGVNSFNLSFQIKLEFEQCYNYGDISISAFGKKSSSIRTYLETMGSSSNPYDYTYSGEIKVGGILGLNGKSSIKNCANCGNITASVNSVELTIYVGNSGSSGYIWVKLDSCAGGIVGLSDTHTFNVEGKSGPEYYGNICRYRTSSINIFKCINYGNIKVGGTSAGKYFGYVGGIAGAIRGNDEGETAIAEISSCLNFGKVEGGRNSGGIAGEIGYECVTYQENNRVQGFDKKTYYSHGAGVSNCVDAGKCDLAFGYNCGYITNCYDYYNRITSDKGFATRCGEFDFNSENPFVGLSWWDASTVNWTASDGKTYKFENLGYYPFTYSYEESMNERNIGESGVGYAFCVPQAYLGIRSGSVLNDACVYVMDYMLLNIQVNFWYTGEYVEYEIPSMDNYAILNNTNYINGAYFKRTARYDADGYSYFSGDLFILRGSNLNNYSLTSPYYPYAFNYHDYFRAEAGLIYKYLNHVFDGSGFAHIDGDDCLVQIPTQLDNSTLTINFDYRTLDNITTSVYVGFGDSYNNRYYTNLNGLNLNGLKANEVAEISIAPSSRKLNVLNGFNFEVTPKAGFVLRAIYFVDDYGGRGEIFDNTENPSGVFERVNSGENFIDLAFRTRTKKYKLGYVNAGFSYSHSTKVGASDNPDNVAYNWSIRNWFSNYNKGNQIEFYFEPILYSVDVNFKDADSTVSAGSFEIAHPAYSAIASVSKPSSVYMYDLTAQYGANNVYYENYKNWHKNGVKVHGTVNFNAGDRAIIVGGKNFYYVDLLETLFSSKAENGRLYSETLKDEGYSFVTFADFVNSGLTNEAIPDFTVTLTAESMNFTVDSNDKYETIDNLGQFKDGRGGGETILADTQLSEEFEFYAGSEKSRYALIKTTGDYDAGKDSVLIADAEDGYYLSVSSIYSDYKTAMMGRSTFEIEGQWIDGKPGFKRLQDGDFSFATNIIQNGADYNGESDGLRYVSVGNVFISTGNYQISVDVSSNSLRYGIRVILSESQNNLSNDSLSKIYRLNSSGKSSVVVPVKNEGQEKKKYYVFFCFEKNDVDWSNDFNVILNFKIELMQNSNLVVWENHLMTSENVTILLNVYYSHLAETDLSIFLAKLIAEYDDYRRINLFNFYSIGTTSVQFNDYSEFSQYFSFYTRRKIYNPDGTYGFSDVQNGALGNYNDVLLASRWAVNSNVNYNFYVIVRTRAIKDAGINFLGFYLTQNGVTKSLMADKVDHQFEQSLGLTYYYFNYVPDLNGRDVASNRLISVKFSGVIDEGEAVTKSYGVYYISKVEHLIWMSYQVNTGNSEVINGVFKVTKDITIDRDFSPIGETSNQFKGVFDGGNKKITFENSLGGQDVSYVGLFGYISGATIQNLNVYGTSVTGMAYVGAVAGRAENSTFTNVNNYSINIVVEPTLGVWNIYGREPEGGNVSGAANECFGGLVGYAENCRFLGCSNRADVNAASVKIENVAGLVGYADEHTIIDQCYFSGKVGGSGLFNGKATATNCYYQDSEQHFVGAKAGELDASIWMKIGGNWVLRIFYW